MPAYAKFMKEIFSKKRKVEETSVVKLIENCSAIFQNKLPKNVEIQGVLLYRRDYINQVDICVQLILGRPFSATGRAILDIQERQLMLRVGDERLIFKIEGNR
ncbi:hypothetical protein A4A49_65954, partial [Nicotiana attenuata]